METKVLFILVTGQQLRNFSRNVLLAPNLNVEMGNSNISSSSSSSSLSSSFAPSNPKCTGEDLAPDKSRLLNLDSVEEAEATDGEENDVIDHVDEEDVDDTDGDCETWRGFFLL